MVWLHMIFENLWDGINDAMPQVLADVGVLVETLSPITDEIEEQQRLRLTLDGIQMALFLIMAPSFHSQIGVSKWAKGQWQA